MCAKLHPYTEVRCEDREVTAGGTTLEMSLPPHCPRDQPPQEEGSRKENARILQKFAALHGTDILESKRCGTQMSRRVDEQTTKAGATARLKYSKQTPGTGHNQA